MATVRSKKYPIREDKQHRIEVHVAAFCFRIIGKTRRRIQLLVAKRAKNRALFPGRWECGGGQVNVGEGFPEALKRQLYEEFGIRVEVLSPLFTYEITHPSGPKIPGVKFLCESIDTGREHIELNEREFTEYRWVSLSQSQKLKMIAGARSQVKQAFAVYRAHRGIPELPRKGRRIGFA